MDANDSRDGPDVVLWGLLAVLTVLDLALIAIVLPTLNPQWGDAGAVDVICLYFVAVSLTQATADGPAANGRRR